MVRRKKKVRAGEIARLGTVIGCSVMLSMVSIGGLVALGDHFNPEVEIEHETFAPTRHVSLDIVEPETEAPEKPYYYNVPLTEELQDYIRSLCEETGVPMSLAIAMIEHESTFNPSCISKTRDYGLMQINKCNHSELRKLYGVKNFLDPYDNVNAGIHMIGYYRSVYGDDHYALMAYNMGEKKARKLWATGVHSTKYSRTVMGLYEVYECNRQAVTA